MSNCLVNMVSPLMYREYLLPLAGGLVGTLGRLLAWNTDYVGAEKTTGGSPERAEHAPTGLLLPSGKEAA